MIQSELAHAEAGGALSPNLSRHVAALNGLLKSKERLEEKARKQGSEFTPEEDRELQDRMRNLVNALPGCGARFVEAARKFMRMLPERANTLEQRPDGTLTEVEPRRRKPAAR